MYKFFKFWFNWFFYILIVSSVFFPSYVFSVGLVQPIVCLILVLVYIRIVFFLGVDKEKPYLLVDGFIHRLLGKLINHRYDLVADFFLIPMFSPYLRFFFFIFLTFCFFSCVVNFVFHYPPILIKLVDFSHYIIKQWDLFLQLKKASATENKECYNSVKEMQSDFESVRKKHRGGFYTNPLFVYCCLGGIMGTFSYKVNPTLYKELGLLLLEKKALQLNTAKQLFKHIGSISVGSMLMYNYMYLLEAVRRTGDAPGVIINFVAPNINKEYSLPSPFITQVEGKEAINKLLTSIAHGPLLDEYLKEWTELDPEVHKYYQAQYIAAIKERMSLVASDTNKPFKL